MHYSVNCKLLIYKLEPYVENSMKNLFLLLLVFVVFVSQGCTMRPMGRAYAPKAADNIAIQLDDQIMQRGNVHIVTTTSKELAARQAQLRNSITVMATVPVNINNLEVSCPLARQMSEEISRWMVSMGYRFQELRKGKEIFFQKRQGEMLLTRDTKLLANRNATSQLVLAGTYLVTLEQVRFSMRLIHTPSNEVIAMGTATVPITDDIRHLLVDTSAGPAKVTPSVNTRL